MEPAVQITLPEIYRDVQDTKQQVHAMNGKLDQFIKLNERLDSHKRDIGDHEDRLRKVEIQISAQWVIVGLITAAMTAAIVKIFVGG